MVKYVFSLNYYKNLYFIFKLNYTKHFFLTELKSLKILDYVLLDLS